MRLLVDLRPCRPALGLALDEALLDSMRVGGPETLRVWINDRSIILGRSQSVAAEVDEAAAVRHRFPILRRVSGGGTVVHYPGNLNVSVVVRERAEWAGVAQIFARFGGALAVGMTAWGHPFRAVDNGIYAGTRKVGGAAQARRGNAILYHTTLMVRPCETPFDELLRALQAGYEPATPASRPRPVTSVSGITGRAMKADDVAAAAIEGLRRELGIDPREGALTPAEVAAAEALARSKYGRREWTTRH